MLTFSSAVLTGVAIVLVAHCQEHGPEFVSMLKAVLSRNGPTKSSDVLDAALWDIRAKQYLGTARVYVHLTAFCILAMACQMLSDPASISPLQILMGTAAWIQHHVVAAHKLTLNKTRIRLIVLTQYMQILAFMYGFSGDCESAVLSSALVCSVRFSVAVLSADIPMTACGQAMFTMHDVWVAWERDPSTVTTCLVFQIMISSAILVVSGLVEFSTRSRIAMLLNSESMVASFRQMLRGLCDGEILLDSNLRVVGKAECLRRLLMTSDVTNQSFEELLFEEERSRFLRFMSENPGSGLPIGKATDADTPLSAPPCLRVSLKGARHRIGVDLFHVKMPHLFGEETYHLVALREDCDSRVAPPEAFADAAPDSTPALPQIEGRGTKTAGVGSSVARSDRSVPQVSSNSLIQICPELQEMTLLVDASTPLLDVEQAHLSFVRRGDEFDCSMPSLRRIVRPTDWGTVRSDLREFALTAGSMQSAAQQRDVLKMKLRLQDDAKRCVEARDVQVSAFSPPASAGGGEPILRKLCLQIGRLKVVGKPKHRCELQGVHEGQSDASESEVSEVSAL
mmetsp:Transcript_51650/g.84655  ORF Transcript_51650/g.84655 Transcript_51650/m.84655 type:complete len:567 (-) Transcript_51650:123-1823(-)